MIRGTVFGACLVLTLSTLAVAGENLDAKLALHVVASADSLGCSDLTPSDCDSIEVQVSKQDILDAAGYGYLALLAYDVDSITGTEFALDGWPSGRGAPILSGPFWCEDALTLGDHEDGGGITAFQACVDPGSAGIAVLAYWTFGPLDSTDLPIDLKVLPSSYSDEDSLLVVFDCTVDYEMDDIAWVSGCILGGTYSGSLPDCTGEDGGGGKGQVEVRVMAVDPMARPTTAALLMKRLELGKRMAVERQVVNSTMNLPTQPSSPGSRQLPPKVTSRLVA